MTWRIGVILLLTAVAVGCARGAAEERVESDGGTTQTNNAGAPERPTLTLREVYFERTAVPLTLNLIDDDSLYAGVVWRDENGDWNGIYEGLPLWHSVADHRYENGELVLTIHTWGERADGTRTPTQVSEVRYTEAEFVDDVHVTDRGELYVLADVVPRNIGQLEKESR